MQGEQQVQNLVEMMGNFSIHSTPSGDYHILNLVELMDNISLESFSESILNSPPKDTRSYSIDSTSSSSTSSPRDSRVPLMRFPEHIGDHWKISWLAKEGNVQQLMGDSFIQQDRYLSQYFKLLTGGKPCPLSFVQIYPNSLNLRSNHHFDQGELIIEYDKSYFITKNQFRKTFLSSYLRMLLEQMQTATEVFTDHNVQRRFASLLKFEPTFYFFELRFVQGILDTQQPRCPYELEEWLYFKLLQKNNKHLPIHHLEIIEKYHPNAATYLSDQRVHIELAFADLRSLLQGRGVLKGFSFQSYLEIILKEGRGVFLKYMQQLTLEKYLWAACCQMCNMFFEEQVERPLSIVNTRLEEVLVPILDLLPHSFRNPNVTWAMDEDRKRLRIFALKEIHCGDILTTSFSELPLQTAYQLYGTVDAEATIYVRVPLHYQAALVCRVIEVGLGQKFTSNVVDLIVETIEHSMKKEFLSFKSEEYEKNQIQNELYRLTHASLKQLATLAEELYHRMSRIVRENPFQGSRRPRPKGRDRYTCRIENLKADRQIMRQINNNVKTSIRMGIQSRKELMEQLQRDLGEEMEFQKEYQLMSLHTILHQERTLLQGFNRSIYRIIEPEEMSLE